MNVAINHTFSDDNFLREKDSDIIKESIFEVIINKQNVVTLH